MKNSFSKIFIQLKIAIISVTIMSSCVETPVETSFVLTKDNSSAWFEIDAAMKF